MLLSVTLVAVIYLAACSFVEAGTRVYDWNITWVLANPDDSFWRPTIGINGEWPLPTLFATVGDQVVVNVNNQLGNQSTTLHFHGLYMNGTPHMDGPGMVTQCPIPPGSKFTYNFTVAQPGTYWYHSHNKGQYPDGLRGALIVDDPQSPFKDQYSEEIVLTVSDWYHDQMSYLIPRFISKANPTGAEPVPDNALFNDTYNLDIPVEPGKTYLFRMINVGAFAGQYIWFEGHNISIIEVDGIYTQPASAELIYLSAAQRCSFLITMRNDTTANFAFMASMDTDLFDTIPDDLNWNVTGWLVYNDKLDKPNATEVDEFNPFDDFTLVPYDQEPLLPEADQHVSLTVIMNDLGDGANYAFFNDITYVAPKVPTLYTALSASTVATNSMVYGTHTDPFVLSHGSVIDIIVNNNDTGKHPFHLHGHNFQAIARSDDEAGNFDPDNTTETGQYPTAPMRRDTFMIPPLGYIVIRFRADNPGIWLFHCHIEWHVDSGLSATMIEAPLALQQLFNGEQGIPADHLAACKAGNIPVTGNAAGNTQDLLNLQGENAPPDPLPAGFTLRGIIALVFSCLAGVLGMAVIVYYGLADIEKISSTDGPTVILSNVASKS